MPYPWNQEAIPVVSAKAAIEPVKGQGLYSTKWNGCRIIFTTFIM